jgi:hypothetical protein
VELIVVGVVDDVDVVIEDSEVVIADEILLSPEPVEVELIRVLVVVEFV